MKNYIGNIKDIFEAFVLTEAACRDIFSVLNHRPDYRHRNMIQPGYTIIYNERITGMSRWIDGKSWSPSKFKDGFFIYSELEPKNMDNSRYQTGLKKKVISVLSPNGDTYRLVNYYREDTKDSSGVIGNIQSLPEKLQLVKEAEKYRYFKCFRTQSQAWRKPFHAPNLKSRLHLHFYSLNSSLETAQTKKIFKNTNTLPLMNFMSHYDFKVSACRSEDNRQLKLLSEFMSI